MKNKASCWCYVSGIISFMIGIVCTISLLFLPIAIYAFIYGLNYFKIAKLSNSELPIVKDVLTSSAIFVSILGFPLGLLSIIPACMAGNNKTKSSTSNANQTETFNNDDNQTVTATVDAIEAIIENETPSFSQEDLEKIEKLSTFRNPITKYHSCQSYLLPIKTHVWQKKYSIHSS